MARITLGSLINSIKGSIGEMVYSTWKGVNYVRSKAVTVSNPQSSAQAGVRARIAECAKHWYNTLTQAERDAWETYAATIPTPTSGPGDIIKPGKGPFSGFNAFIRNNLNLFISGQNALGVFLTQAPIGVPPPDAPSGVAAAYAANQLQVSWTPGTIPGVIVSTWALSTGASCHAQLISNTAVAAGISLNSNFNGKKGATIPFNKVRGFFDAQVIAYDNQGQPSPVSALVPKIAVTGI